MRRASAWNWTALSDDRLLDLRLCDLPARLEGTELEAKVTKIAEDLKDLRAAPAAEPYAGPAMLSGRAAAVFFHEVFGHRAEGS